MLMLLVLLTRRWRRRSAAAVSAVQVSRFSGSSSKTASMTMSWPAAAAGPAEVVIRDRIASAAVLLQLALGDLAAQVPGDAGLALLGQLGGAVREGDRFPGRGADLGDAVPHQARADDEDAFDAHGWLA